jgi:hypothetical protein
MRLLHTLLLILAAPFKLVGGMLLYAVLDVADTGMAIRKLWR